jgi:hypothetical protein
MENDGLELDLGSYGVNVFTVSVGGCSAFEGHLQFVKNENVFFNVSIVCNSPVFYLTNGIL